MCSYVDLIYDVSEAGSGTFPVTLSQCSFIAVLCFSKNILPWVKLALVMLVGDVLLLYCVTQHCYGSFTGVQHRYNENTATWMAG